MANWGQQSTLLRGASSMEERVSILEDWFSEASDKKLRKFMISAFRSLNNPNRYQFYLKEDTVTHEKFLTYLVILAELAKRHHEDNVCDMAIQLLGCTEMSKTYLTLYYIFKLYHVKRKKLGIKIHIDEDAVDNLPMYAKSGGAEFKKMEYYDFMDMIKRYIKDAKKDREPIAEKDDYDTLLKKYKTVVKELEAERKKNKGPVNW